MPPPTTSRILRPASIETPRIALLLSLRSAISPRQARPRVHPGARRRQPPTAEGGSMPPEAGTAACGSRRPQLRGGRQQGRRMPAPLRIGLAGLGTVGAGVLRLVETHGE